MQRSEAHNFPRATRSEKCLLLEIDNAARKIEIVTIILMLAGLQRDV